MFTSEFNERSRSNPLCDFRLGTLVTSDHETPLTVEEANCSHRRQKNESVSFTLVEVNNLENEEELTLHGPALLVEGCGWEDGRASRKRREGSGFSVCGLGGRREGLQEE